MTTKIAVLGSGKVGRLVTWLLVDTGDYHVTAVDRDQAQATSAVTSGDAQMPNTATAVCDLTDQSAIEAVLKDVDYVLSCAPFHCNPGIAAAAKATGTNYLDLTEDVAVTKQVKALAEGSDLAFIPQCGLAPGAITIIGHDLAKRFDHTRSLRMRVGALPVHPHNRLNYNVTWSTEGLINEYRHPCEAMRGGEMVMLPPLEDLETITIDGLEYEAFNTSGGLGSLSDVLAGKCDDMDYKSIRYPGHRELLKVLMDDLRLQHRPELMVELFENALPYTTDDVVLIVATAVGERNGRVEQEGWVSKTYSVELGGETWGAIQITTAAGLCAVLDMHVAGDLPKSGFVRQEEIDLEAFLTNRFGQYYLGDEILDDGELDDA